MIWSAGFMSEDPIQAQVSVDRPAPGWSGRIDGKSIEYARWHQQIVRPEPGNLAGAAALIGFCSDAGVRRNSGRLGAVEGPASLRSALSTMALHDQRDLVDCGDVVVTGDELESGQERLAVAVAQVLDAGALPIVLGGGHETAFGTGQGLLQHLAQKPETRVGILNLDAHFDLRNETRRTSGTPFLDLAQMMRSQAREFNYAVLGISAPSNTAALFAKADELRVEYLLDEDCQSARARMFVADFLERIEALYLTIDLDVLPASVAPGVSAPAGFGVALEVIISVCKQVRESGKLAVADVVELNPKLDIDSRTARTAARLIYDLAGR